MRMLPVLLKDGYKVGHKAQYPAGTKMVYSNLTPRNTRRDDGTMSIVFFGLQYFVLEYLIRQFNEYFFQMPHEDVVRAYKRRIDNYLGPGMDISHIGALHERGHLPLLIKALPEGTLVPYGVPAITIRNTEPEFFWLTNMLETLMSSVLWKACTSATTALGFHRVFSEYAKKTGSPPEFVQWQGHDFSFRGMCGVEDAAVSGAGHLLSFTGTDTIPAIDFLEQYYGANSDKELIGGSVAATEHSVMCMGGATEGEQQTIRRLITDIYPTGIVSIVSDTWDLWRVLTEYLPALKNEVMARNGRVVIRPDSGDPVKILLGDSAAPDGSPARAGVVELLWNAFGGTKTSTCHRLLDTHVGTIYGDSINRARQLAILDGLEKKGFASANVVLGLGSYTYQYVTRDTDGWAMKATAGRTERHGLVEIFKDPVTDSGFKKSARGLLRVDRANGALTLQQRVTEEEEMGGELQPVFKDGELLRRHTLAEIRARVAAEVAS